MEHTYLDNSATTPVCREAADKAMYMMTECFGNPSSLHTIGIAAERELIAARKSVAALLDAPPETILFTSGGTEANNLAILGGAAARRRSGQHVITTAVEHPSVSAAFDELEREGFAAERLSPNTDGIISPEQVAAVCRTDTVLVSIMLVNNETGARFPLEQIIPVIRQAAPHALIHCDAVQAAGKLPIHVQRLDADLVTVSAHKIHAPKGSGALYIKKGVRILPRALGGGQERNLRSGTEAMPMIAAFGAATDAVTDYREQEALYIRLHDRLLSGLAVLPDIHVQSPACAVPYIINLTVPGIRSETMLHFLAERHIYVSSGSACSKGHKSPVLTAMGISARHIDSALRVSLSRDNTDKDIDRFLMGLKEVTSNLIRK